MPRNRRGESHYLPNPHYIDTIPRSWKCGVCGAGSFSLHSRAPTDRRRAYCTICGFPYKVPLSDETPSESCLPTPALSVHWRVVWRMIFRQFPDGNAVREYMSHYDTPKDAVADAVFTHPPTLRRLP